MGNFEHKPSGLVGRQGARAKRGDTLEKRGKEGEREGNRRENLSTSQVDWLEDREPGQIGGTHWRREEKSVKLPAVGVISC